MKNPIIKTGKLLSVLAVDLNNVFIGLENYFFEGLEGGNEYLIGYVSRVYDSPLTPKIIFSKG